MVTGGLTKDDLRSLIRSVPDFPKKGIVFKDVTTLLKDPKGFRAALDYLLEDARTFQCDVIVGIEARGFIFGSALAERLGVGFVPARKKGKLPASTRNVSYHLEYGTDTIEIHADAISKGTRVLLHDDLLATGGTMRAAVRLVEEMGGVVVGISFLVELSFLKGRSTLAPHPITSVLTYDSE